MDKGRVRKGIKDLQRVKTWQLVILLILASFIAATFLRLNNIGMVERREAVISADEAGDDEVTIKRLYDLQRYVSAHMNTDLGAGVPLQASYDRAYESAVEAVSGDANPNGNIYKKAKEVCDPQFGGYSAAYQQCFLREIEKYPAADELKGAVDLPVQSNYMHDFESPVWSPDFAGWSLVVCAVIVLLIIARLIGLGVLRLLLHRHYKSA